MERMRVEQHTFLGGLWFAGWPFTIGFLHLDFWRGLLAIVLWAYYLGAHFSFLGANYLLSACWNAEKDIAISRGIGNKPFCYLDASGGPLTRFPIR